MNQTLATSPSPSRGQLVPAALTLWQREMVRFFRQRNRVIGAFATPVVFWVLLGSGLNQAFDFPDRARSPEVLASPDRYLAGSDAVGPQAAPGVHRSAGRMGYLEYLFPGALVMILLFTAIFSTISVIDDRRDGFLQAVLVAPIPRLAVVGGKVLGGASIAVIQGMVFLSIWPLIGGWSGWAAILSAVAIMFLLAIGLTALGLCIAWAMDSAAGFHAVMNLLLFPMWFLCGAMFPPASAPAWLRVVMYANPLTYGQAVLSATLHGPQASAAAGVPLAVAGPLMIAFAAAVVALAAWVVSKPGADGT